MLASDAGCTSLRAGALTVKRRGIPPWAWAREATEGWVELRRRGSVLRLDVWQSEAGRRNNSAAIDSLLILPELVSPIDGGFTVRRLGSGEQPPTDFTSDKATEASAWLAVISATLVLTQSQPDLDNGVGVKHEVSPPVLHAMRATTKVLQGAVNAPLDLFMVTKRTVEQVVKLGGGTSRDAARNIASHRRFVEATTRFDRTALEVLTMPNATLEPVAGRTIRGRSAIIEHFARLRRMMVYTEISAVRAERDDSTVMESSVWHFAFNVSLSVTQRLTWEGGQLRTCALEATADMREKLLRVQRLRDQFMAMSDHELRRNTDVLDAYEAIGEPVAMEPSMRSGALGMLEGAQLAGMHVDGVAQSMPVVQGIVLDDASSAAPARAAPERAAAAHAGAAHGTPADAALPEGAPPPSASERQVAQERAVFSTFDFGAKLGAGTFGIVFFARSKADGRTCAIKAINKAAQDVRALENEIRIMRAATAAMGDGPSYVVTLYETYEGPEFYYLAMEALSGGEVYKRLAKMREGHYTEAHAKEIVRQTLEGITRLHAAGIMHRDLKPENLLYVTSAENAPVKIADFGLSCFFEHVFHVHDVCGTPIYYAPELLIAGEVQELDESGYPLTIRRSYGPSVDVWACGCILFQLLSGSTPFEPTWDDGDEQWDFAPMNLQILAHDYDMMRATAHWPEAGISSRVRGLLAMMLDGDPSRRPTAAAVLEHPWFAETSTDAPATAARGEDPATAAAASDGVPFPAGDAVASESTSLRGIPSRIGVLLASHHASRFPADASRAAQANARKVFDEQRQARLRAAMDVD